MLGFAQLGVAFTEPDPGAWTVSGGQHLVAPAEALRIVVKWGRDSSNDTIVAGMGGDLAAATQLHAVVVEELFTMYGRSASAREPRGTADPAPGAELWGAGSWRNRALASLYGGDPLAAAADGSTPWKSPTGAKNPGAVPGILYPEAWPTRAEAPYPGTTFAQPEARRLLSLARQFDQLTVYHTPSNLDAACRDINRPKTADILYRSVEAAVRTATCFEPAGSACVPTFPVNLPDPAQNFADFLLYQRFGITPEHADLVASHLAELLEPVCVSGGTQVFGSGSRNLAAIVSALPPDGYKLSRDATFGERGPLQVQPAFGRYAPLPLSLDVLHDNSPAQQGFRVWPSVPLTGFDDVRRLVGSSAAFAAARAALLVGKSRVASSPIHVRGYFTHSAEVLNLIAAEVGDSQVVVRPEVVASGTNVNVMSPQANLYRWRVTITTPIMSDPGTYKLFAIVDEPAATALFDHPSAAYLGKTAATLAAGATAGTAVTQIAGMTTTDLAHNLRTFSGTVDLAPDPTQAMRRRNVTLILERKEGAQTTRTVIAAGVSLRPQESTWGYYLSSAGSLGAAARKLVAGAESDPATPAYDGFGYRASWIPPTDPEMFGASGEPVTHYIERAEAAAATATEAVQQAFNSLLQQQTDEAALSASEAKGKALFELERDALCGANNTECNTLTSMTQVVEPTSSWPQCDEQSFAVPTLECASRKLLHVATSNFAIADEVVGHLNDPKVPSFAAYAGGSLQSLFLDQWSGVRDLKVAVDGTLLAYQSALALQASYIEAMNGVDVAVESNCSENVLLNMAINSCETIEESGCPVVTISLVFVSFPVSTCGSVGKRTKCNPALAMQYAKCHELRQGIETQRAQAIASYWDSVASLSTHAANVQYAADALAQSSAALISEVEAVDRVAAQAALETKLLGVTQLTSQGLYRKYHNYDLFRAKATLEDARRYAAVARRAIESRFVTDLSSLTAPEALVAAPYTWADEVYEYDLSLPASVGLSVGVAEVSGVYPNKVADYVGNLRRFADGYAINRPSASAHGDSVVVDVFGPDFAAPLGGPPSPNGVQELSFKQAWSFRCASGEWVSLPASGKSMEACGGGPPVRARVAFSLDPWARLEGSTADPPLTHQYNVRWGQLAVNLVGTAVKECSNAPDPQNCYTNAYIPFDLTHIGPAWVTDYAQTWHSMDLPKGRIEHAKALAAEHWLDPVSNGWEQSFVQAIARDELFDRPLGGEYLLELEVGPDVKLERIERVQLLVSTSYWVKQD